MDDKTRVAIKYLRDLAKLIEKGDEIELLEFEYGTQPEKIPNDTLGVYEYRDTGFRSFTVKWKEKHVR